MSLHHLAKHVQAKGRGEDKMLVHMTPKEVEGLQAIAKAHGGSLSVNPDTGLVEAGFLKQILPAVAGAGLMMIPGMQAWGAGLIVGGAEALRTGDITKGLTAGLGAYGGAGLTSGLSQAGAAAAPEAGSAAAQTTNAAAAEKIGTVGNQFAFDQSGAMVPSNYAPSVTGAAEGTALQAPTTGSNVSLSNVGRGIGQLGSEQGRSAVYDALPKYTLPATGVAVANAMTPEMPENPDEQGSKELKKYKLNPNFQGSTPVTPNPYYRAPFGYAAGGIAQMAPQTNFFPQSQVSQSQYATPTQMPGSREVVNADFDAAVNPYNGDPRMMRGGGKTDTKPKAKPTGERNLANMEALDATLAEMNNARYGANMSQLNMPKSGIAALGNIPYTVTAAQGGQLGSYSDGGRMLKGPGDGMSDSIPASIGGKQPARLADGEFVVPADVVSHLGNGSTDAGAKKLYAMMDKVRMARTGKKKQAPAVKADRFLA